MIWINFMKNVRFHEIPNRINLIDLIYWPGDDANISVIFHIVSFFVTNNTLKSFFSFFFSKTKNVFHYCVRTGKYFIFDERPNILSSFRFFSNFVYLFSMLVAIKRITKFSAFDVREWSIRFIPLCLIYQFLFVDTVVVEWKAWLNCSSFGVFSNRTKMS